VSLKYEGDIKGYAMRLRIDRLRKLLLVVVCLNSSALIVFSDLSWWRLLGVVSLVSILVFAFSESREEEGT
jgi:hypothetical protein